MNETGPSNPQRALLLKEITELEEQLASLKAAWPAHSLPPAMFQQIEDIEYQIEQKRAALASEKSQPDSEANE